MSKIREIRAKQERIARQIENEKRDTPAPLPTPISTPGGPPVPITVGVSYLAKTREGSQADGQIRARLLNQFRTAYGEDYDCYAWPDQSASDMTDFLPNIASSDIVCIKKLVDGNWYLDQPDLIESSDCT
ncbi:MAG: hypothetical protein GY841_04565 [FCB group bacterium]|nr:hypothetical protein [FCB group bacterium]